MAAEVTPAIRAQVDKAVGRQVAYAWVVAVEGGALFGTFPSEAHAIAYIERVGLVGVAEARPMAIVYRWC